MSFTHPRTGRTWATEAMAIQMDGPLVSPAAIGPGQTGTLVQTGEFAGNYDGWIEPLQVNYVSSGPSVSVDAWLNAGALPVSPTNYGTATNPSQGLSVAQDAWAANVQQNPGAAVWGNNSPAMADLDAYYRKVSGAIGQADILATPANGGIMPSLQEAITALTNKAKTVTIGDGGATTITPSASQTITDQIKKTVDKIAGGSDTGAGTDTGTDTGNGILSGSLLYLVGGIALVIVIALMFIGRSRGTGARA